MVDIVKNGLTGVLIAGNTGIFSAVRGILIHKDIIYISDTSNHCIKVCTPEGIIITLAGGGTSGSQAGHSNGTGTNALFNQPVKMAIDSSGQNLYIVDRANNKIRKLDTSSGVVTTFAGGGTSGMEGGATNGTGTSALFGNPQDIAIDTNGNLYIVDQNNNFIRKITTTQVVSTYVGYDQSPNRAQPLGVYQPLAITIDESNNLFVLDYSMYRGLYSRILKIDTAQSISLVFFRYNLENAFTGITINGYKNALYLNAKTVGFPVSYSIDVLKIKNGIEYLGPIIFSNSENSNLLKDSYSIAVDSLHNVYVADPTLNTIRVYNGPYQVVPAIITSPTTTIPPMQAIPVTSPGKFGWIAGNWVQYYAPVTHYYVVRTNGAITNVLFMFNDGTNTKIVDWDGKACYYIGPISNFKINDLGTYQNTTTQYIYVPPQNPGMMNDATKTLPIKAVTNYFNLPMFISLDGQYLKVVSKNQSAYYVNSGTGNIATLGHPLSPLENATTNYIVNESVWLAYYTMIRNLVAAATLAGGGAPTLAGGATTPTLTGPLTPTPTESPCGMAFDPLGNIYVSYPQSNNIYKQNQLYFPITATIQLNTPLGLCYLNNTLYIADWGNSRIVAYNGTTATTIAMSIQPYGLCAIGNILYITGQDYIYKYDTTITLVIQNPGSDFMFMCANGVILYICDNTSKSVRQYNTQTNNLV